ncbi:MAG: PEP-CTERM sorting domain-containing protein [Sphingomonas sanxanigenens]|uniref:PEP-CTERM sorting domain-containing protein n=1 Tax=Sphingomonas sanxanigenens TaxID=397260 RepID=A0A2W5A7H4_9SPHN|nr:MAG: PEP-CTERM sorting domain-containing protein [Sphingomonas sanxanigenens]
MNGFLTTRIAAIAIAAAAVTPAAVEAAGLDLSTYQVSLVRGLQFDEASGVTYNWDRNSLMVVGDEGTAMEFTTSGDRYSGVFDYLGVSTYNDLEIAAYVGNGQYVFGNERTMRASLVGVDQVNMVDMGGGLTRYFFTPPVEAQSYSFSGGVNVGNIGLEGITYDPITGGFFAVKENNPQAIYFVDQIAPNATRTTPFDVASLGLQTLSDIMALSNNPNYAGADFYSNLLILSQSSQKLLEVTRTGELVSSFDLSNIFGDASRVTVIEGVTIDHAGNIYLVAELGGDPSSLIVLSRANAGVPEPATWAMLIAGFGLVGGAMRRRARTTVSFA